MSCRLLSSFVLVAALAQGAAAEDPPHLHLSGYLQTDATLLDRGSADQLNSSTGEPENDERVSIRRARLRAQLERGIGSGGIELDANTVKGPQARLVAADVSVRWPARAQPLIQGSLGLFKIPFGYETQQITEQRLFLEPSTAVRALFPGERDLGLRVQGGWRFVRYQLAAMNGEPIGERAFPARDPNAAKDIVGRAGVDSEVTSWLHIAAGVSGLHGSGFHRGTPSTKDTLVWKDGNQDGIVELNELVEVPGQAETPAVNFGRFALGGDLVATAELPCVGTLTVYGELLWASNLDRGIEPADPVSAGRDLRELGWTIGVTQEFYPHFLAGLRYDRYDPDADDSELSGSTVVVRSRLYQSLALVGAWRFAGMGQLTLEYDVNRNHLGRGVSGVPASRAADTLILRAQVTY